MDQVNTQMLGAVASGGLSPIAMFAHASLAVKIVMLLLLACSVLVWAIVIQKSLLLRRANRQAAQFEDLFWAGGSLDDLYESQGASPTHPMAAVFGAAMGEWRRSARIPGVDLVRGGARERIDRAITITLNRENERLRRYMALLATIGPVAPFIGLFGTVWGIMVSFGAIAAMNNTSLAVVAPGISEALFATAMGLATAIPAYVAYNLFSAGLADFSERLEGFGTEFSAILSRQSEEHGGSGV